MTRTFVFFAALTVAVALSTLPAVATDSPPVEPAAMDGTAEAYGPLYWVTVERWVAPLRWRAVVRWNATVAHNAYHAYHARLAAEAARKAARKAAAPRPTPTAPRRTPRPATEPTAPDPAPPSGSVWDALARCESGGDWSVNTGNGYYGGLQFSLSSWAAVGGSGYPHEHSRATQIAMAERLRAAQGWGAWPACSRKLGLR